MELERIKEVLFHQVDEFQDDYHEEERKFKSFVDRCFDQKISGSLLIIGPDRSDKRVLVDRILKYAQSTRDERIEVANINGNVHSTDQDAILTIANQLNIISSSDSHICTFESIQAHFQQSRLQCRPTVLIIEAIEQFSKGRQVMLYTLLDLLHRNEYYYMVVGLTTRADISRLLEKRVLSRLNSECLFIRPRTLSSIILNLKRILILPSDENDAYIQQFNEQIEKLFDDNLVQLISRDLSWGRSMEHFLVILRAAICRLSTNNRFLTSELIVDCFKQMELPFSVLDTLQSLPPVQLYILIAIIRLHCRVKPSIDSDSSKKLKRKRESIFTIKDVLIEIDRIMGLTRRKVLIPREIYAAIGNLAQYTNLIALSNGKIFSSESVVTSPLCESTIISLRIAYGEMRFAFSQELLKLPDRLRRAVLEPSDTSVFTMTENSLL